MKKIFLFLIIAAVLPVALASAEMTSVRPYWSFEVKGGVFAPAFDEWSSYYGREDTTQYGASLAYKFLKWAEIGVEGSVIHDKGHGFGVDHNAFSGNVTTNLYPLNVFVLARGQFIDNQWLVPYIGGGWTRIFYRQEIKYQSDAKGSADGYHARAGIQLLLDALDPDAANRLLNDYGVYHTYLFLEAVQTRAMTDTSSGKSVDLGGKSWLGGLLFEF